MQVAAEKDDIPLIIWLNGGPACSSMDGLFIENGPFRLVKDDDLNFYLTTDQPYSWHKGPAYTLYIDQPVGTGLSFTTSGKYPRNDEEVNIDFYYFLHQFFSLHSDKFVVETTTRDLYFSGESYAGHYIPSLMNYILKQNKVDIDSLQISVRGGAVGNGWTDPYYQYAGADFAYGHGLIDLSEVDAFKEKEKTCQAELNKGNYNVAVCFNLIDDIVDQAHGGKSDYKASGYDVRKSEFKHESRKFPPGHKVVETYLGGHELPNYESGKLSRDVYTSVLKAIHASAATEAGQVYEECTDPPYNALAGNDGKGVVDDVVEILEHADNVQLLFFNGIHDIVCNHVGNERFLEELPWEHAADWRKSDRYAWVAETETPGQVSGYMKEYKNLKFLKIMNAGHMVPMDVPNVAADMMKLFTYGGSFETSLQKLKQGDPQDKSCPVCPTCYNREPPTSSSSEESHSKPSATVKDKGQMGTFVISYAWMVAGLGFLVFLLVIAVLRRRSGGSSSFSSSQRAVVPQYDIELRDSVAYRDEPINKFDENGNGAESRVV